MILLCIGGGAEGSVKVFNMYIYLDEGRGYQESEGRETQIFGHLQRTHLEGTVGYAARKWSYTAATVDRSVHL